MLNDWAKQFGPVFTGWMGKEPIVAISDIDIGRECFKKSETAGRPNDIFGKISSTNWRQFL